MSLHPSLKKAKELSGTRSVMTRTERIKWLKEKGKWEEGNPVLGLPKIKIVKLKAIKKEKAKDTEENVDKKQAQKPGENKNKAAEKK